LITNQETTGRQHGRAIASALALLWLAIGFALFVPGGLRSVAEAAWPSLLAGCLGSLVAWLAWRRNILNQREGSELALAREAMLGQASEALLVTDAGGRIVAVNPAFEAISGYAAPDVLGRPFLELAMPRQGAAARRDAWDAALAGGQWAGDLWGCRKNGEIYPESLRITAIAANSTSARRYVVAFTDISGQKAQEARIDYLAHHDPVTGLPNRLALEAHLQAVLPNPGQRLALLMIDLDNFKTVNDSLGHHAGDQLLAAMASRLEAVLDEGMRLFRLGGDEFVIVVERATSPDDLAPLLSGLMQRVGEVCEIEGHALHISASVGISLFPNDGDDAEALIRNADTAMYFAKANGRNNFQFFVEPMNHEANKRLNLESELWQALAENQLLLHYQPQVDLLSGKVVGVEALVRWQHPTRGLVGPDEFIPIAEACGLILPLGHWVLLTACRQAKTWLDAGIDMGEIAVNISAQQFRQPDFAHSVQGVLSETGLPAGRLELEITESTIMHSADSSIDTLVRLKAMGVRLAIDDFGTGYSSLAYLRRFPIDRLKIDRSFVADVESDTDAASLVTSIVSLGRSLGLNLVAEGVETSAQADFLRALDCQRVQGFHFFRPVSAEEVVTVSDFVRPVVGQPA